VISGVRAVVDDMDGGFEEVDNFDDARKSRYFKVGQFICVSTYGLFVLHQL